MPFDFLNTYSTKFYTNLQMAMEASKQTLQYSLKQIFNLLRKHHLCHLLEGIKPGEELDLPT